MKNTTKRVLSAVLAIFMLMGLLSVSAFAAEGIVITAQPQSTVGESGGEATFSVTATGEDLSYQWYMYDEEFGNTPLYDDEQPVEGAATATLKVKGLSCWLNDVIYFCEISDADGSVESEGATVTVPHDGVVFYYDEETHMQQCNGCGEVLVDGEHSYGDDTVCDDCGYDSENPVPMEPIILESPEWQGVNAGENATFSVVAYGIGLTYQWYKEPMAGGERVMLTDGEKISGATTNTLVLKGVTCDMTDHNYICYVSNEIATPVVSASLNVWHTLGDITKDAFMHYEICFCGEEIYSDYHNDEDCDGTCDTCDYAFAANAPKLTAQPKDVELVNGEDATFTVAATGEDLTYQWYRWGEPVEDGERFTGASTATLKVHSIYDPENEIYDCAEDTVGYYCIVTNANGAVQTTAALYDIEHEDVSVIKSWDDEYYHENYCVCESWIKDTPHVDADKDGQCDLCPDPMFELFDDVTDPEVWYYDAAVYGKAQEIFIGEYGKFLPNDPITRGELATVISRMAFGGETIDEMTDGEFEALLAELKEEYGTAPNALTDIEGYYYERYAKVLAALGVVYGYDDGTFRGETACSRQEMALIIVRFTEIVMGDWFGSVLFDEPIDAFADADQIAPWAQEDVELARELGIFAGDADRNFHPTADITRAETAQVLMRLNFYTGVLW